MSDRVELSAPIVANLWQLRVHLGDRVEIGTIVAVLETMKMEIPLQSPVAGIVVGLPVPESTIVQEGDPVAVIEVVTA